MWVVAHRGASGVAPENTLAAFRRAAEMGADFVETDLQLSRDARLVALHDDTLERTTNGRGAVSSKTLEELRELDAGAWFLANPIPGEHIPTIDEVLKFGRKSDVGLYLELKSTGPSGAEHALLGALHAADEIRRSVVICFSLSSLVKLRGLEPMLVTGYLYEEDVPDAPARAVDAGARQLLPRADLVTPESVKAAHRRDLKVVVWTVNEEARMKELMDAGVDGIITNYPDRLLTLLARG